MAVQRLLQQLLQRQDHALLTQAQGFVLIQVTGHAHGTKKHQRQGRQAISAQINLHYVS
ncbi:hypothetical protein D3C72_2396510 [compost metagenome]